MKRIRYRRLDYKNKTCSLIGLEIRNFSKELLNQILLMMACDFKDNETSANLNQWNQSEPSIV
jgi:hypothetical protein